jgi:hypothetical protein
LHERRVADARARSDLRKAAGQLDGEIETMAKRFGFRFVDPRGAFDDHRICGSREDWIHGVTSVATMSHCSSPRRPSIPTRPASAAWPMRSPAPTTTCSGRA